MNQRALPSLGIGIAITLGLFFVMTTLVRGTSQGFEKDGNTELPDFVRARTEEITREKEREMPKRPDPPKRPPTPTQQVQQQQQTQQQSMDIDIPDIDVPVGAGGGGVFVPVTGATGASAAAAFGDGDLIPMFRSEPQWPREALIDGISGYVVVQLTVMEDGTVQPGSVKVVEAKPPRMFDSSAMRAVARWKFKPRIVDGKPVKQTATQRIDYTFTGDEK